MIETTINAQTKTHLSEDSLARSIKELAFPQENAIHIYNFFTDVPIQDIEDFIFRFGITDTELKEYYEKYIKDTYVNVQLEELMRYA